MRGRGGSGAESRSSGGAFGPTGTRKSRVDWLIAKAQPRFSTPCYYFSSLKGTAEQLGRLVRRHWAIENELHWGLDVTFGEDGNRTRDRNASANLGVVRRTVLSLLKQSKVKGSKKSKAFQAALSTDVLEEHLRGNAAI